MKKLFNFFVYIIISGIIGVNLILFSYFKEKGELLNIPLSLIAGVLFLEILLVILVIQNAYKKPIDELSKHINYWMTGGNKGKDINLKIKSLNPKVKYIVDFISISLSFLQKFKEEIKAGKVIKGEVELAMELQEKLLNKKAEKIPSLTIIGKSKPAGEIGGDSFDIIKGTQDYYIYVGDATGHGVGAGFVMVMVNALISGFSKIFRKGSEILAYTNEILKPRVKSNILMTVLLLRWNEEEKRLFMAGAGHEYLIVYKHSLNKCFKIKSGGLALGMTKNIHKILKEQEVKFEKNDIVVLYTDGITESINQRQKDGNEIMFGEQKLMETIEKSPNLPGTNIKTARGVFNNITIEISKFLGYQHIQEDDITLVVAHYHGGVQFENDFPEEIPDDFITEWYWD